MSTDAIFRKRFWVAYVDGKVALVRSSRRGADASGKDLREHTSALVTWKVLDLTRIDLIALIKPDDPQALWDNAEPSVTI